MQILILSTVEFTFGKNLFCVRTQILPLFSVDHLHTHILLKNILGTPTYIGCFINIRHNLELSLKKWLKISLFVYFFKPCQISAYKDCRILKRGTY